MDELTIDDKKYISTKRAAQITGYAKDYVGQLCREGYVEAKRIGRGWYVLESGIKDHRFGGEQHGEVAVKHPNPAEQVQRDVDAAVFTLVKPSDGAAVEEAQKGRMPAEAPKTVESPHYASDAPPPINLLKKKDSEPIRVEKDSTEDKSAVTESPSNKDFHEAWQAWFDTFNGPEKHAASSNKPEEPVALHNMPKTPTPFTSENSSIEIPIRPIRSAIPQTQADTSRVSNKPILEVRMEDAMHHISANQRPAQTSGETSKLPWIIAWALVVLAVAALLVVLVDIGAFASIGNSEGQGSALTGIQTR